MIWLILLGFSLLIQSHIDAGLFGLIGFPIIAAIYASIRHANDLKATSQEIVALPPRMAEFLTTHPALNVMIKS